VKPKISIVSLAVADIGRSLAFYRDGLGFPTHNYAEGDDYVMLVLGGAWLSLLLRPPDESRAQPPAGAPVVGLSHNVTSPEAVRAVYEEALAAGATPVIPPRAAPWGGWEASFADPDGHLWDIAYNPFTDLT
jgi:uncharacterized protein